jgi:hypothetical protein
MKRKSPFPRRGTPHGDQLIGQCRAAGCERELRRGDPFITLIGDVPICDQCNRRGFKLKEAAMQ